MKREDQVRIAHMLDAAQKALSFADGHKREDLESDEMLLFALVHSLEIVGEAANQVSEIGQKENANIPWADVIAIRNRLIHGYIDIDPDIVWQTVTENLPPLVRQLKPLL